MFGKEREEEEWRKSTIRPLSVDEVPYLLKIVMVHLLSATQAPPIFFHTSPGVSVTAALIFIRTKLACFYFDNVFWEVW